MEGKNQVRIAAVRIRGKTKIKITVEDTMKMMRLYKNNFCAILPNNPVYLGMLRMAKDYLTWGEIDEDTFRQLLDKRGEQFKGRESDSKNKIKYDDYFMHGNKKYKKFFRLNSPKKGMGRKGVKRSFKEGGALGYRGAAINDLIRRML